MKNFRRITHLFLLLPVLVLSIFLCTPSAFAEKKYPDHPIDLLVPSGPGGGADQIARFISPILEKELKVPFPVSNLHGAGGNAALSKLISSRADGYSQAIFMGRILCSWATVGLGEFKIDDFEWLVRMVKQESAFFVPYNSPIKNAEDLFRIAKERPLKVAIHGHGNTDDISVRFLNSKGLKFVSVPFAKPAERYMAPIGGHVDVLYEEPGDVKNFIEAKQIRPVVIFSKQRSAFFPNLPTTYELGYEIGIPNWRGLIVRKGTPQEVINILEETLQKIMQTPLWAQYLKDEMAEPDSYLGPDEFSKQVRSEFEMLNRFAKEMKLQ